MAKDRQLQDRLARQEASANDVNSVHNKYGIFAGLALLWVQVRGGGTPPTLRMGAETCTRPWPCRAPTRDPKPTTSSLTITTTRRCASAAPCACSSPCFLPAPSRLESSSSRARSSPTTTTAPPRPHPRSWTSCPQPCPSAAAVATPATHSPARCGPRRNARGFGARGLMCWERQRSLPVAPAVQLPDCFCNDETLPPRDLEASSLPQMITITFGACARLLPRVSPARPFSVQAVHLTPRVCPRR